MKICRIGIVVFCLSGIVLLAGCSRQVDSTKSVIPEVKASYASEPVKIDGVLDDDVWQVAEVYSMNLSEDKLAGGPGVEPQSLHEPGKVRVAWDDNWLYVAFDFTDSDVVAEGKKDGLHHYKMGDLAEVFIKPDNQSWCWELYATPTGKKTTFFFPSQGRMGLPSNFEYKFQKGRLKVAAKVNGTLNNYSDRDKGWTAEMAIPISELTSRGEKFDPQTPWRLFVGRYNYSYHLPRKELSMMPRLPKTNYHLIDSYATLKLEPKGSGAKAKK